MKIDNTFEVETHKGVTIKNPTIEVVQTIDKNKDEVFIPHVRIISEGVDIYHELPPQPYVNGTWDDPERDAAIQKYFESL